jgi:hypothetical protein
MPVVAFYHDNETPGNIVLDGAECAEIVKLCGFKG